MSVLTKEQIAYDVLGGMHVGSFMEHGKLRMMFAADLLDTIAARDAEVERLNKALEQIIECRDERDKVFAIACIALIPYRVAAERPNGAGKRGK